MALPKIASPEYELEIPSTKEKITYRPFLVKEEKLLLLAQESDNQNEINRALKNIVKNCTFEKVDPNDLAMFDLEYVFLNIRSKSVGEIVELKLLCEDDGETYADVSIDLNDVKVDFSKEHTNIINLVDNVHLVMDYPHFDSINVAEKSETEGLFNIIKSSIKQIVEGETIYERADFSEKELDEFLDSLTSEHFKNIQNFFETMPRLRHEVRFKNPNTKKQNKVILEGLNAFFG